MLTIERSIVHKISVRILLYSVMNTSTLELFCVCVVFDTAQPRKATTYNQAIKWKTLSYRNPRSGVRTNTGQPGLNRNPSGILPWTLYDKVQPST